MITMNDKQNKPKMRGRGRQTYADMTRGDSCHAGAGGDNQTSTLNAEAPEFRPPTALMEQMRLDRTLPQTTSRVPVQIAPNTARSLSELVTNTVQRVVQCSEDIGSACEQLLSRISVTSKEDLVSYVNVILSIGEKDPQVSDTLCQIINHLGESFVSSQHLDTSEPLSSRPFLHVFMLELENRISSKTSGLLPNGGYIPGYGSFVYFISVLYSTLDSNSKTMRKSHMASYIINFMSNMLELNDSEGYDFVIKSCTVCGPAIQDDLLFMQKQHPQYMEEFENLFHKIRLLVAQGHINNVSIAIRFINLLELRAANWGRVIRGNSANNTGAYSRQCSSNNSEGVMDDDMYECYERFLAETGQI